MSTGADAATAAWKPWAKVAIEIGPLIIFFAANWRFGIFAATGVFMVAAVAALAGSYWLTRKLPVMPLVSTVLVLALGGLTIYLADETFIKVKPTAIYLLFAAVLSGGLAFGKSLLKVVFGEVFRLEERGWKLLSLRWALFFVALAILNEAVWRSVSTDTWVAFKTFGFVPLTAGFMFAQIGLLQRYDMTDSED